MFACPLPLTYTFKLLSARTSYRLKKQTKERAMKRKIEIFTANCPLCDPLVKLVDEVNHGRSELTVYNMVNQGEDKACLSKAWEYGVYRLPAVVVDGKLLSCCKGKTPTKKELIECGLGGQ